MTLDTIFDVASLTKVVATTTAVMALVEDGRIRLDDRVSTYIPGFERLRQGPDHHSPPADARVGPAPRSRSRRAVRRRRCRSDPAGRGRSAGGPARRAVHLLRHRLLPARPHRRGGVEADARTRFCRREPLARSGWATRRSCPPHRCASASRRPKPCEPLAWPCTAAWRADAARRRPRSDGAPDGRRGRSRGPVQHRRRPGDLRPDDPGGRQLERARVCSRR